MNKVFTKNIVRYKVVMTSTPIMISSTRTKLPYFLIPYTRSGYTSTTLMKFCYKIVVLFTGRFEVSVCIFDLHYRDDIPFMRVFMTAIISVSGYGCM